MNDKNLTITTSAIEYSAIKSSLDFFCASLTTICLVFGVLANIESLAYFGKKIFTRGSRRRSTVKIYFEFLYTIIVLEDILTCFCMIPVIEALFNDRYSTMLANKIFCTIWGVIYETTPLFKVFLVAVLSITRAKTVIEPHNRLNVNVMKASLFFYFLFLILLKISPIAVGTVVMEYATNRVGCNVSNFRGDGNFLFHAMLVVFILVAMPLIPIIVSSFLIVTRLRKTGLVSHSVSMRLRNMILRHARTTKTIIIVTGVYLFFNIPLIILLVYQLLFLTKLKSMQIYGKGQFFEIYHNYYSNDFLYSYFWLIVYKIFPAMNSAVNPVIYYLRMDKFRLEFFKRILTWCEMSLRVGQVSQNADVSDQYPGSRVTTACHRYSVTEVYSTAAKSK